jgi:flagellar biogenesis protein FliO
MKESRDRGVEGRFARLVARRAIALPRGLAALTLLAGLASSGSSLALEPAGGSPEATAAREPGGARDTEPDASVERAPEPADRQSSSGARSWLARGNDPAPAAQENGSTTTGLTLSAIVIVLGLAGAAIYLRFKRQTTLPLTPSESRLVVLSSSRVGPKAFAVTAHVNGRVLLLGVTDHSVTNLGWLDPPELEAAPAHAETSEEETESDELPDDYPGSALRASKPPAVPFATTNALERFQEVLRGVSSRNELPMRPSYAPRAAPDAATTLAAQTTDVVAATAPPVHTAASLRRKRRGGRDSIAPREPRIPAPSRGHRASDASLEGQVAGLRTLRNGG